MMQTIEKVENNSKRVIITISHMFKKQEERITMLITDFKDVKKTQNDFHKVQTTACKIKIYTGVD